MTTQEQIAYLFKIGEDEAAHFWRERIESLEAQLNQTLDEVLRPYRAKLETIAALVPKWINDVPAAGIGRPRDGEALQRCAYELEALLGEGQ